LKFQWFQPPTFHFQKWAPTNKNLKKCWNFNTFYCPLFIFKSGQLVIKMGGNRT